MHLLISGGLLYMHTVKHKQEAVVNHLGILVARHLYTCTHTTHIYAYIHTIKHEQEAVVHRLEVLVARHVAAEIPIANHLCHDLHPKKIYLENN